MIGQQELVQPVRERFQGGPILRALRIVDAELVTDTGQQFQGVQRRVQDDRNVGVLGQLLKQAAVDGGFARANLASEQYEAPARAHAIQQVRQRVAVACAHEQVAWIHRDGEGCFREPEVLVIHAVVRQPPVPDSEPALCPRAATNATTVRAEARAPRYRCKRSNAAAGLQAALYCTSFRCASHEHRQPERAQGHPALAVDDHPGKHRGGSHEVRL